MQFINFLKNNEYQVGNNLMGKSPGFKGWNTIPNLYDRCDVNGDSFFLRMGDQLNGDYVIGLDFDVYKKSCKDNKHKKTYDLLQEFKNSNKDNHGHFNGATYHNEGCIVSIKNCPQIIQKLDEIGKTKFQNKGYELELLCGSSMVLPPTKTKCKMTNRLSAREFLNSEHPILNLQENTPQYKIIFDYIG